MVIVEWTRNENGALAGVKSRPMPRTSSHSRWPRKPERARRSSPTLLGISVRAPGPNVFVGFGERLVTPPLSAGCLAGINRELLIEALGDAVEEADIRSGSWPRPARCSSPSTGREVQPVRSIDGRVLARSPGPLTEAASGAWKAAFGDPATADP